MIGFSNETRRNTVEVKQQSEKGYACLLYTEFLIDMHATEYEGYFICVLTCHRRRILIFFNGREAIYYIQVYQAKGIIGKQSRNPTSSLAFRECQC